MTSQKSFNVRILLSALTLALILPFPSFAESHRLEIEPYLWTHVISGDFGVKNLPPAHVDGTTGDIFPGFSGRAAYLDPSGWGFLISGYESSGNRSGTSQLPEFPGSLIELNMGRLTLAPAWQLPLQSATTSRVWVGAQASFFSMNLKLTRADFSYVSAEDSRTWWDPVIGGEIRHPFTEKWFVYGSGGLGGFGVNSRLITSLMGAVGYQFDPMFSVKLGYRYEMNDYEKDGLVLDGTHQGAIIGIQFNL
jgi:hypothetical protein